MDQGGSIKIGSQIFADIRSLHATSGLMLRQYLRQSGIFN
jgi:hypothetical protein